MEEIIVEHQQQDSSNHNLLSHPNSQKQSPLHLASDPLEKMVTNHPSNPQAIPITVLYEAALKGNVETLHRLIQNDQLILHKASLTSFHETPLHVSALMGHLDFTNTILTQCPKMAMELDSSKRSPLHLASAEGHCDIVKALLGANVDVCLRRDEDGRIPLHLAAMRGRIDVIKELIRAKFESKHVLLDGGTVLHLCVRYNHLEALKSLVEMVNDDELVIMKNQEGNTILHLAVMLKQVETVNYLLTLPEIRAAANTTNEMGLTALDVLDNYPKDFKTPEIRDLLIRAGIRSRNPQNNINDSTNNVAPQASKIGSNGNKRSWFGKFMRYMGYHQAKWIKKSPGSIMVIATVIATMSFQAAVAPPGGFFQQDYIDNASISLSYNCSEETPCYVGSPVFSYVYHEKFSNFTTFNSIAFYAALSIIFVTAIVFPLHNKFIVWLLTFAMVVAASSLAITFRLTSVMLRDKPDKPAEGEPYRTASASAPTLPAIFNNYYWLVALLCGFHIVWLLYLVREVIARPSPQVSLGSSSSPQRTRHLEFELDVLD